MKTFFCLVSVLVCSISNLAQASPDSERLITILQTNDIHGGLEPSFINDTANARPHGPAAASMTREKKMAGGMDLWGGIVQSIRKGLAEKHKERAGVVLVDAGDQFQGTLLSNFTEGQLLFAAMKQIGYDAVVPGNHDFDFGPKGWLEDTVSPASRDQDPRGALKHLAQLAQPQFPLLSANTYFRSSIADKQGNPVEVDNNQCAPRNSSTSIDWSRAKRPDFFKPYRIKEVAGLRVALIGLDNPHTASSTMIENVSDLCFRDSAAAYREIRHDLEGQAEVFVLVIHDGNSHNQFSATALAKKLTTDAEFPGREVHAIVAGHTHFKNELQVNGVPIIQSEANGTKFGRIDLTYDLDKGRVIPEKTRFRAAIAILPDSCDEAAQGFCSASDGGVSYEGVPVSASRKIADMIRGTRKKLARLSNVRLGYARETVAPSRTGESPLTNALTDALREYSGATLAFWNGSGIRAPLEAGPIIYENFFRVMPFNNRGVVLGPVTTPQLLAILAHSAQTCGSFDARLPSGLRVVFERDCEHRARDGVDSKARLKHVETLDGKVLLEAGRIVEKNRDLTFSVATLDFLSKSKEFKGIPFVKDIGIIREKLAHYFLKHPLQVGVKSLDGRWKEVRP